MQLVPIGGGDGAFPATRRMAFYPTTMHSHITQISATLASLFPTKHGQSERQGRAGVQPLHVSAPPCTRMMKGGQGALRAVIYAGSAPFGARRTLWSAHLRMLARDLRHTHVCSLCCWGGIGGGEWGCWHAFAAFERHTSGVRGRGSTLPVCAVGSTGESFPPTGARAQVCEVSFT